MGLARVVRIISWDGKLTPRMDWLLSFFSIFSIFIITSSFYSMRGQRTTMWTNLWEDKMEGKSRGGGETSTKMGMNGGRGRGDA
jgi:hypothetical protein